MRARAFSAVALVLAVAVLSGCGVGGVALAIVAAPVWVPYCLLYDCELYAKAFGPDAVTGTVRIENDSRQVFLGLLAYPPGGGPPFQFSGSEEPLLPGGCVELALPIGAWPQIELQADDGSTVSFWEVVVTADETTPLHVE